MNTYKSIFEYDGTNFFGWQKQPDQKTVQGTIENILERITKSGYVTTIGSGRTDRGVHAKGQVVKIVIDNKMEPIALKKALNSLLPKEIRCLSLEVCEDSFQPVFDAKAKVYRYYFSFSNRTPFFEGRVTFLKKSLDLSMLHEACARFVGEHNFVTFSTKGTLVKSTIRKVSSCKVFSVEQKGINELDELYCMEIIGNGFLKQMVRLIVSSIWAYAEGKIELSDIENALNYELEQKLAPTAPPDGLYLHSVHY